MAVPPKPQRTRQGVSFAASIFLAHKGAEGWELYFGKWFPQFWLQFFTTCLFPVDLCSWHSWDVMLPSLLHQKQPIVYGKSHKDIKNQLSASLYEHYWIHGATVYITLCLATAHSGENFQLSCIFIWKWNSDLEQFSGTSNIQKLVFLFVFQDTFHQLTTSTQWKTLRGIQNGENALNTVNPEGKDCQEELI